MLAINCCYEGLYLKSQLVICIVRTDLEFTNIILSGLSTGVLYRFNKKLQNIALKPELKLSTVKTRRIDSGFTDARFHRIRKYAEKGVVPGIFDHARSSWFSFLNFPACYPERFVFLPVSLGHHQQHGYADFCQRPLMHKKTEIRCQCYYSSYSSHA